jgi:hypothetical protein
MVQIKALVVVGQATICWDIVDHAPLCRACKPFISNELVSAVVGIGGP